jgi:hypothetical protein
MTTISKQRRNEASILTSFRYRSETNLLIPELGKSEAKQIMFIPQIRKIEAGRTLFIPQIGQIEEKRSLFIQQIRKNEAE